ncbi:hypothetical protein, partial [Mycobacterium avium]
MFLDEEDDTGGEVEQVNVVKIRGRGTTMEGYHFQAGLPEITVQGRRADVAAAVEPIQRGHVPWSGV